jgi:hypothetical protein
MNKASGCLGFTAAVVTGLVIGVIALGVAGWHWVNTRALADEPEAVSAQKWTKLDEAALAAKLAPLALLMKQNKEGEQKVVLSGAEATRMLGEYFTREGEDCRAAVSFGDTATGLAFSREVLEGKYLNGELRAEIKAKDGEFQVKVFSLRTGGFKWPESGRLLAARLIEGELETQALLKDMPLRIMDYASAKDQVKLTIKVVKQDKKREKKQDQSPAEEGGS